MIFRLCASMVLVAATSIAAEIDLPYSIGSVSVPPGYTCIPGKGYDSQVGKLQKGDFIVQFDFGRMAGVYTNTMKEVVTKELHGKIIRDIQTSTHGIIIHILVYSHGERSSAIVSYPEFHGNFYCDFSDEGHLVDFMTIASSFIPKKKNAVEPRDPANP